MSHHKANWNFHGQEAGSCPVQRWPEGGLSGAYFATGQCRRHVGSRRVCNVRIGSARPTRWAPGPFDAFAATPTVPTWTAGKWAAAAGAAIRSLPPETPACDQEASARGLPPTSQAPKRCLLGLFWGARLRAAPGPRSLQLLGRCRRREACASLDPHAHSCPPLASGAGEAASRGALCTRSRLLLPCWLRADPPAGRPDRAGVSGAPSPCCRRSRAAGWARGRRRWRGAGRRGGAAPRGAAGQSSAGPGAAFSRAEGGREDLRRCFFTPFLGRGGARARPSASRQPMAAEPGGRRPSRRAPPPHCPSDPFRRYAREFRAPPRSVAELLSSGIPFHARQI